jgi:hypothetical protein
MVREFEPLCFLKININMYYILVNKMPSKIEDYNMWAKWNTPENKRVDITVISDEIHVSTVFLGIDHSFGGNIPILFETMIFGGKYNEYQCRYTTWDEAVDGHRKAVEMCLDENILIKLTGSFKLNIRD